MSDEAIKAALEAACWAECEARARVNECEEKRCPRREPCQWCKAGAAAAIAAFLHDRARTLRQTMGLQVYADFCEAEAAAVERAAKEARDA